MSGFTDGFISQQLISSVDPKLLKLTKSDEEIYTKFREAYPDLSIHVLDPDLLKSADAKEVREVTGIWHAFKISPISSWSTHLSVFFFQKWRPFCNQFEGVVEDFNYGTLLRLDCQKDYTEENTIFGMWCHKFTPFSSLHTSYKCTA